MNANKIATQIANPKREGTDFLDGRPDMLLWPSLPHQVQRRDEEKTISTKAKNANQARTRRLSKQTRWEGNAKVCRKANKYTFY